ncbi:MAG TPA: hemin uptake protein HemP [Thermodesulfobacteriota bacterium]
MTTEPRGEPGLDRCEARCDEEPAARPVPRRRYPSRLLFEGSREVLILHGGEEYRLRITRAGKLILTK